MDTINKEKENNLKIQNPLINIETNSNFSNLPNFVENCLKILENFTLMLLSTSEKLYGKTKLNYCYCCFNTIRWQIANPITLQRSLLVDIAKSIIKRLQNSLGLLDSSIIYNKIADDTNKNQCILSPNPARFNISKKKTKRKLKIHRKSKEIVNIDFSKKFMNKFYENLFYPNANSINYCKGFNVQNIIDQMYFQIRSVLSENCIDDVETFKDISWLIKDESLSKPLMVSNQLPPINRQVNNTKYKEQLWSGDCKINDDHMQDIFSDQFDKFLSLENLDVDVTSLTDNILSSNNKTYFKKLRYRHDSDMDEGFSENEFLYDIDSKSDGNLSSENLHYEQFSYCGDCHYNSSNSKSDDNDAYSNIKHILTTTLNDEDSDSDGGTELLNSVNDSLNKFNAFMQNNMTSDAHLKLEDKSTDFLMNGIDQETIENVWPIRYPKSCDKKSSQNGNVITSIQKLSFDNNEILSLETNSSITSLSDCTIYKDEQLEPPISNINNQQQISSLPSLSNFNYDNVSKLLVSPVNIQNWCSYNFSQIASSPCNYNYHNKPSMNIDTIASNTDNFCNGKLSNWRPSIPHGMLSTNSYIFNSNHLTQPFHRIMISPHITIPNTNMGPIQHNIVHLPQLFHQIPHSMIDTEYFERRQRIQLNQQNLYTNPNNNNSSSELSMLSPINLIPNSNGSNMTSLSSNFHQPISIIKSSLDKSQRACCFYMRGGCKKEDCEYAHDLSKVTCKFWEKGDCFKADTCPFKHGYMKN